MPISPKKYVIVPFGDAHLSLSLSAAHRLRDELNRAITDAERNTGELRPPAIDPDGFLDKKSFREFFSQIYGDKTILDNHSGKLQANIIKLACYEELLFNIVCELCDFHVVETCRVTKGPHYYSKKYVFLYEAASLKELAQTFLDGEWADVGPVQKADFKLLVDNLP